MLVLVCVLVLLLLLILLFIILTTTTTTSTTTTTTVRIAAEECKARGADIYIITDKPELAKGLDDSPIIIPENGMLTPVIAALPLQLIAYELSVLKGINPDVPRNLAKAVTTD